VRFTSQLLVEEAAAAVLVQGISEMIKDLRV